EVRVYSRALSPAEIATDMGRAVAAAPGLVAGYSFDDGAARDVSGNGHDGTIVGATPVADGRFGGALSFARAEAQYVEVPDSAAPSRWRGGGRGAGGSGARPPRPSGGGGRRGGGPGRGVGGRGGPPGGR